MNLDDLKDRLREQFQSLMGRVQESSAWIELSEKFQNLSSNAQKAVFAGIALFVCLFFLALPWLYFSGSQSSVAEFEEKRGLIRELFRVSRAASNIQSGADSGVSGDELRSLAESALNNANIPQEQRSALTSYDNRGPQSSSIIPKNVIQDGVEVSLSKLNLNQVVDVGHKLQSMHPNAKMVALEVKATREDPHYFDVIYKIVGFSLPVEPEPQAKGPAGKNKKPSAPKDDEE